MNEVSMKLYKKTNTGAIQEWEITYGSGYFVVMFGQFNGKKQTKIQHVTPKNVGKANETSPFEQAKLEALARYKKQLDKGYVESLELVDKEQETVLPMLAYEYDKFSHKVKWPGYVSRKYDGQRLLIKKENNKITMWTRTRKIVSFPHIEKQVLKLPIDNITLDGELYYHGEPFQEVMSWIKREQDNTIKLNYHVFDLVENTKFIDRYTKIIYLLNKASQDNLKPVEVYRVENEAELWNFHDIFVSEGYEGAMLRYGDDNYSCGKRSHSLLKVKSFLTDEFEIIGAKENEYKPGECSFILKYDGGEFDCVMKGTAEQRQNYWKNHKKYFGKNMTVKYFGFHENNGRPRFPVGLEIGREERE